MIIDNLNELKAIVNSGNIPDAKFHWGMHDIGFIDKLPKKQAAFAFAMKYRLYFMQKLMVLLRAR